MNGDNVYKKLKPLKHEESEMPKFHETFLPILDILSDSKIRHYNDLKIKVRDKHFIDLTADFLAGKKIQRNQ